ncbi:hypothetical protein DFJ73DRAFT_627559 [Zopfochytrium polystomum]|nr:hypothetical protein DFJ73DRAFT_627559 [Zopfochytrium polystomum]
MTPLFSRHSPLRPPVLPLCTTPPRQVVSGTKALGLDTHTLFYHVEPTYYSWPLEKRVLRLSAPSVRHLCKTLIFENTRHAMNPGSDDPFERTNSKYYAVVVQYAGKMNTQRLINFVYEANAKRAPKKAFNFRMAPEEVSHRLSGYATGGVTPFGLAEPRLPVVVARQIADLVPPVLFLGAGHVDWKMAVPVARFVDAARCFVVDLE